MDFDYEAFFRDLRQPKEAVRVFEIGGRGFCGLGLEEESLDGKLIVYREIHRPSDDEDVYDRDGWRNPDRTVEDYHKVAEGRIANHKGPDGHWDKLRLPWDVKDIPYPLPDNFFDEVHCHMIDDAFVHSQYSEKNQTPFPSDHLSLDTWVREIARISAPDSTFFATIQRGYFFEEGHFVFEEPKWWETLLYEVGSELESNGFGVQSLETRPIDENWRLHNFTNETPHVNGVILARRGIPSEDRIARKIKCFSRKDPDSCIWTKKRDQK